MYTSQRIVLLQMHKTGCSHIAMLLRHFDGGSSADKHSGLNAPSDAGGRMVVTSVRNPWDWYVSLWAYGCAGKGSLYARIGRSTGQRITDAFRTFATRRDLRILGRDVSAAAARTNATMDFRELYRDANNVENFRKWLTLVLGGEGHRDLPEGYAKSRSKRFVGFFTYRHLRLVCSKTELANADQGFESYEDLLRFYQTSKLHNKVILMEALEEGVAEVLRGVGKDVNVEELRAFGRTNSSNRSDYRNYYDDRTIDLVRQREKLLIDAFGYTFD